MKPGIYDDLSGQDYHEARDWVSTGLLKSRLPEHYKKPTTVSRDALDFGIAFHTTILGVGEPVVPVVGSSWRTNQAKADRDAVYASGGIPLLSMELPRLDAMRDAVEAHSEAYSLLYERTGSPEVSVFAEVDGVPSKCRFDRLLDGIGVDVKTTTAKPSPHALTRAVIDYGYDLQAVHYMEVARAAGVELERFVFVFVDKEKPHHVTVCDLDDGFIERGKALRDLALQRWLHPTMVDAYPGQTGRLELVAPRWAEL